MGPPVTTLDQIARDGLGVLVAELFAQTGEVVFRQRPGLSGGLHLLLQVPDAPGQCVGRALQGVCAFELLPQLLGGHPTEHHPVVVVVRAWTRLVSIGCVGPGDGIAAFTIVAIVFVALVRATTEALLPRGWFVCWSSSALASPFTAFEAGHHPGEHFWVVFGGLVVVVTGRGGFGMLVEVNDLFLHALGHVAGCGALWLTSLSTQWADVIVGGCRLGPEWLGLPRFGPTSGGPEFFRSANLAPAQCGVLMLSGCHCHAHLLELLRQKCGDATHGWVHQPRA